ncbi:zinc-binding alcohol dehydrogenase family protein [Paenibacillus qinlingensis]|uniref:zinc-binding alcohol dehydrogenase family protein n=1 Tax=Paenibacillus qinlingensis TaxID=1837343 RepID=UPI00286DAB8A|nr:zinc-binding alcohol dehydrogenase family protein [Paenibacillus qinlingensis]
MKAIICEQIGQLKYVEVDEPVIGRGETLVRMKRIGICGTDLHAYRGNQPFFSYPRILGHELAGYVEEIGEDVTEVAVGDLVSVIPYLHCGRCVACRNGKTNCCTDMKVLGVHIDGGMVERVSLPVSHLIKADGLTLDQAAMLEPLSIGAHAVRRSELRAGETALVIGAGPIGLGVMVLAKQLGANVIAMDINEERLAFCREWAGVHHTVNALELPKEKLAEITNGEFPTVVFDATGNARSMTDAFGLVAHGGKLVYVGLVKADIAFHDPDFHKKELTLMGSRNATMVDFHTVRSALLSGSIDIERYITHRSSFAGMVDQFETWLKPESKVIKAMVCM